MWSHLHPLVGCPAAAPDRHHLLSLFFSSSSISPVRTHTISFIRPLLTVFCVVSSCTSVREGSVPPFHCFDHLKLASDFLAYTLSAAHRFSRF